MADAADQRVQPRQELWDRLGVTPRGIDRENVEMLHRTHMGVDNDPVNLLLHGLRTSLSDGWGGSMIATELSDIMFGTPAPVMSTVNLGTLKAGCVFSVSVSWSSGPSKHRRLSGSPRAAHSRRTAARVGLSSRP